MSWSVGNIAYLALVILTFGAFITGLAIASLRCSRPDRTATQLSPLPPLDSDEPLKAHGDKFGHILDLAQ